MWRLARLSGAIALGFQFLARPVWCAEPVASPADDGADVVESIDSGAGVNATMDGAAARSAALPPPSPAPVPATAPSSPERLRVSAWARQLFELGWSGEQGPAPASVPHDRFLSSSVLFAEFDYLRRQNFAIVASGFIDYHVWVRDQNGAPARQPPARADYQATLSELFVGVYGQAVDFRLGQQRVAWGRSDMQSPNDVLNARDLRSPVLLESNLLHLPTPLARLDVRVPGLNLQGVFAPIYVPDRYDVYGTNWALIQPRAPSALRGLFGLANSLVDPSLTQQFNRLIQQTRLPPPGPRSFSGGVKAATSRGKVDVAAYYQFGFDPTPRIRIDPRFAAALVNTDFSMVTPEAVLGPVLGAQATGTPVLRIDYQRRHHFGFDAGTVVGPIGLRLDAGYDSNRVFLSRGLATTSSPALQAIGSVEYQTGDLDQLYLIEVSGLHLFSPGALDLLFFERTTWTASAVIRVPLVSNLRAELRALGTLRPQSLVVRPELRWKIDERVAMLVGALCLAGSSTSFGGYFERNAEAYVSLIYEL